MTPHKVDLPPPARRLVLFVGDGLRADKLYQLYQNENNSGLFTRAPFLRDIVLNHGTWGVSHTRVPTESRPGHVAIIAGFYEDVSAVTKGWKMNPVEFDSVFNQSGHTWSFGSPDILPMFAEGASDSERVDTFMYGHESENFAEDATELDTWTFNKFAQLLSNSSSDPKLYQQLHDDKIIVFLHLLGLDTNGHAYGPHSKEYLNNIKVVDDGIYKTIQLLDEFYGNDRKTAYIFTSDHGMSNRGNHGDGHPDNTRTPIIAWGAGINKPNKENPSGHDEFSMDWQLNSVQRNDILQADIAPLMASLIGINYPVNSVGELPLKYLNNTPLFKAQSIFVNAKEILEQYKVKYESQKRTKLMFKPYTPLSNSTHFPDVLIKDIQRLIDTENYVEAENLCRILIDLCLEGLRYFQTYDWFMLRSIVTAGYVGWIIYSLKFTLQEYALDDAQFIVEGDDPYELLVNIISIISLTLLICVLYVQESPITYYTYVVFPVYFWRDVIKERKLILDFCRTALGNQSIFTLIIYIIGYIIALEILVYSYFERSTLSICFLLAALWPWLTSSKLRSENTMLFVAWTISCLFTSTFTLLPVEKGEDISLVIFGGLLIVITGCITLWKSSKFTIKPHTNVKSMIGFQVGLVVLSMIVVYDTDSKLKDKTGLPLLNQITAWQTRKLEIGDSRIALAFLFFIKVAFFGTGNIASLSSFSLQISSVFGIINKSLNLPPFSLFLLVLSTTDIMTLNFFYLLFIGDVIVDFNKTAEEADEKK
ncbi:15499_t:CDS:10, partial [Cetraspora pellucida]